MKKLLKKEGFTLVELIVVIAILAILAAVAIPAYSGYISKANEAADYQLLDSVYTATVFAVMDADPEDQVTEIVVSEDSTDPITVSVKTTKNATSHDVEITEFVEKIDFKSTKTTATWTNTSDKWTMN